MKKTLVAIAALVAVGAVSAQSSVTLYGRLGAYAAVKKTTDAAGVTTNPGLRVDSGGASSSRIGMQGVEDLGGGLKAKFKLEGSVGLDSGTFTGFNRNSWVALEGGFGTVSAGLQWTPFDSAYGANDPQGYANYSAHYMVFNNTKGLGGIGSHGDTFNRANSLMYTTPNMGGFSGKLMWAPGEDAASSSLSSQYTAVSLHYNNGPISVNFAAEKQRPMGGVIRDTDGMVLGGTYDFGVAKATFDYVTGKGATGKDKGYAIGFGVPMGPANWQFAYARDKTTNATGAVNNGIVKGFSTNVNYALSKRTDIFVAAARLTGTVAGATSSSKYTEYGVGIRHNF